MCFPVSHAVKREVSLSGCCFIACPVAADDRVILSKLMVINTIKMNVCDC